jgi:hypothetical protein
MTLVLVELAWIALLALAIVSQIALPALRKRPLFPLLRRGARAERRLAEARRTLDDATRAVDEAKAKRQTATHRLEAARLEHEAEQIEAQAEDVRLADYRRLAADDPALPPEPKRRK